MKHLVVLGGGTAGTMAVNKLRLRLPRDEWTITVVDQSDSHYYQPGFLFIPFGIYRPDEVVKPRKRFIPSGVELVEAEIDRVVAEDNKVLLVGGQELAYDYLIIATGTTPRPDQTPGMAEDMGGSVHEFYTYEGATRLAEKLKTWDGGQLVIHITEMPIKCPVAPLGVHLPGRGFLRRARHARPGRDDLRHPAWRARSPSRCPRSTWAPCSRNARSPWSLTSWSSRSIRRRGS